MLDRLRRRLSRSPRAVRWALKLRNQCNMVVGYALSFAIGGSESAHNGEDRLLARLAPQIASFVDVGANLGEWTAALLASRPDARGLLLEPGKVAFEALERRFAAHSNLQLLRAAVADAASPREMTFYEEAGAGQTSSLVPGGQAHETHAVPVVTLDALLAREGWSSVDYVKIDVEGFDLHVLRGARGLLAEQRIGALQFEYNAPWRSVASTLGEALYLLESSGYAVYLLSPQGLHPFDYRLYGEFYSYANFVALSPAWQPRLAGELRGALSLPGVPPAPSSPV